MRWISTRRRLLVLILAFVVADLTVALVVVVPLVIPEKDTDYYPGISIGSVTILLGQKRAQTIGYTEREDMVTEIKREWHENGQLARDTKAFDAAGHEISLLEKPRDQVAWRPELAFFREVDTHWDNEGHILGEWEFRKGVLVRLTWYWPKNERQRCRREMRGLRQDGDEEVWDSDGRLVFHGRFKDGDLVEILSGDPGAKERPPQ